MEGINRAPDSDGIWYGDIGKSSDVSVEGGGVASSREAKAAVKWLQSLERGCISGSQSRSHHPKNSGILGHHHAEYSGKR